MFQSLDLREDILDSLAKNNFTQPTEIQEKTIPLLLQGKDLIGRSQTGSGKTLAYALPIIQNICPEDKVVQALIVCPTRELASQVADEIHKITGNMENIKTTAIFGGANMDRQIKSLKQGTTIVVGTPGRIMDHLKRKTLKLHRLKTVVLDEADEMLNMGFREDIETILKATLKTRQTVMFSATMPKAILDITENYMHEPITVEIGQNNNVVDTIEQTFIADKDKQHVLLDLILTYHPKQCIVFCNTKRMVDNVVSALQKANISALGLHGDKRQNERKKIMSEIKKSDNTNILVATDVAARGIDIKDVDYVINYDIPQTTEYYVHRIGRTARAGKKGKAITLINTKSQAEHLREIENETGTHIPEVNVHGELILRPNKNRIRKENSGFERMPKNMKSATSQTRNSQHASAHNNFKTTAQKKYQGSTGRSRRGGNTKQETVYKQEKDVSFETNKRNKFSNKQDWNTRSGYQKNESSTEAYKTGFKSGLTQNGRKKNDKKDDNFHKNGSPKNSNYKLDKKSRQPKDTFQTTFKNNRVPQTTVTTFSNDKSAKAKVSTNSFKHTGSSKTSTKAYSQKKAKSDTGSSTRARSSKKFF